MIAVKLARENYRHKRDNLVDLAGYVEILHESKKAHVLQPWDELVDNFINNFIDIFGGLK